MGACTRHGMTLGLILCTLCETIKVRPMRAKWYTNWGLSKLNTYVKV